MPSPTSSDLEGLVARVLQSPAFRSGLQSAIQDVSSTSNTSSLSTNTLPVAGSLQDELRRLFPSIRRPSAGAPISSSSSVTSTAALANTRVGAKRNKKRTFKQIYAYFTRDVFLLTSHKIKKVLSCKQKVAAFQSGQACQQVKFDKSWDEDQILQHLREVFQNKMIAGMKYNVVIPMSGLLMPPTLAPGEVIDGCLLYKVSHQKALYVRPEDVSDGDDSIDSLDTLNTEIATASGHNTDALTATNQFGEVEVGNVHQGLVSEDVNDCSNDLDVDEQLEMHTRIAIQRSLQTSDEPIELLNTISDAAIEKDTLQGILSGVALRISTTEVSNFNVDRNDVMQGYLRATCRKSFSPFNKLSVLFTDIDGASEGAVDLGGPKREMFTLLLLHLQECSLFEGTGTSKNLSLDSKGIDNNLYYHAGQVIALSLVHGGPGPRFFSETLFTAIAKGIKFTAPEITDVGNYEVREQLKCIDRAESVEELNNALQACDTFLVLCGCQLHVTDMLQKEAIVQAAVRFYVIERMRTPFEQFEHGLNTLNILDEIRKCPEVFKPALCFDKVNLTASVMQDLFQTNYSEAGTNNRVIECRVVGFWRDYLQDSEENEVAATLGNILQFCTGAADIPPLGFQPKPSVMFLHGSSSLFPYANTCSMVLQLPIVHATYIAFKESMDSGIKNGMCFAFA